LGQKALQAQAEWDGKSNFAGVVSLPI